MNDSKNAYWAVVSGSNIWLVEQQVPQGNAEQLQLSTEKSIQIGEYQNIPFYWINAGDVEQDLPMTSLYECLTFPEPLFLLLSKAVQYGHMTQTLRFCPQCGGRNHFNHRESAMQCSDCRTLHYPRIFPCIIVAVRHEGKILLANHSRHDDSLYTVLAGFVEVGETLELCVQREVEEETGIKVKNIRYFGSQPWAFPSSMMVAFLADYDSGEIKPDYTELMDAQWYSPEELPAIPREGTIARALIEHTVAQIKQDSES